MAFARTLAGVGGQCGGFQDVFLRLATAAAAEHGECIGTGRHRQQRRLCVHVHQRQPLAAVALQLEFVQRKDQQPPVQRQAGHLAVRGSHAHGRQQHLAGLQREETFAAAIAAHHVAGLGQQAEAAGVGQQQRGVGGTGKVVRDLRAGFKVDQRRDRHTVTAPTRQQRGRHAIGAARSL